MSNANTEACPRCGAWTLMAPGIGPFCPNLDCDAGDDLRPDWKDRAPSEADLLFRKLRGIGKTEAAALEDNAAPDLAEALKQTAARLETHIAAFRDVYADLMRKDELAPDIRASIEADEAALEAASAALAKAGVR